MRKKITQRERVKDILLTNKIGITSFDAFKRFGITRLSAIIYDLRHKEGMDIVSIPETRRNRYGDKTTFDRYVTRENEAFAKGFFAEIKQ